MNGFSKGMGSFTFFPHCARRSAHPGNAWASVGNAFRFFGDNMRKAMYEQPPRKEDKQ
jgi:hypothetical protein